jgi:hypothetical protein
LERKKIEENKIKNGMNLSLKNAQLKRYFGNMTYIKRKIEAIKANVFLII